jgi:TRAP-type C4-dicarboxylate transport system substrate-binding protein
MVRKSSYHFRIAILLALGASAAIGAQAPVNIRLATLAPENSPWSRALRSMGAAWEQATDKRVQLTVYAGTIPSESSAIARMAVDGLQAATLMAPGLAEIDEAFNVFGIPFFFESDAELAYVQQKLTPVIRERLRAKRYQLINWGNGGWIQLLQAADPNARRCEAGEDLHDRRQSENGAVVHGQRVSRRAVGAG